MRGPTGRRPPTERFVPDHRFTTPTPVDPWQFNGGGGGGNRRDSDASFCSSRPSSSFSAGANNHRSATAVSITDRSYQSHAVSTINSYLSACSFPISFKLKPLPSNKDITETLKFVLTRLEYPPSNKFEDDLFIVLKYSNCPIKMNKSALKAPGTPHSFPSVLAVLHWLVQIAMYNEHLVNSTQSQSISGDSMFSYTLNTYLHYIRGDDDAVEREDDNFMEKLQQEKSSMEENVKVKSEIAKDLEAKLEAMKSGPSPREAKEEEKTMLEKDIKKFNELIEQLRAHEVNVEKLIEEKEKELGIKIEEKNRICQENEELKKKVEEQAINMRDADRMKRELQSVERDIGEAEIARNKWEEKCWDLNALIGTKFKELEALQIECNQALRRLKLGNDFQYELNAKGSTPAEVLGMDYKSTLKPALSSSSDEVKRTSMENLESLISLQQLSHDITAKIDAKRNRIAVLQSRIDEMESHLSVIKNETQDYTSRCAMEARQLVQNFEAESHNMDVVEKEALELVENSKARLQETKKRSEEEVEMCGVELLALIDSVSKYKELIRIKISEMKREVSETAGAIAQIHKASITSNLKT
ncbi:kinetochore protein NDC80 homolog [Cynara cardunculus var. scolymus]|uniref:Kinetochore protein NDC80 n=1 Tax=Cynara cardunculus var. scolymus TaxID=59895 RepID=A0A103Y3D6_CYNCS|nr:kinetochore protein NDC80 homolog [Cynara cardunculus var. scolymus]KVI01777.1 Kinetochore protein Ndc80 [Cynara cardunculus var. scolymus]